MRDLFKDKVLYLVVVFFLSFFVYGGTLSVPRSFPIKSIINLESGLGLSQIAEELRNLDVIRSPFWFRIAVIAISGEKGVQAGDYFLNRRQSTFVLAWRMVRGEHGLTEIKITVPEGFSDEQISNLFDERFPLFDKKVFLGLSKQGYLFPDTYFVKINITADEMFKLFNKNFENKIATVDPELKLSKNSLEEIITMASVLEGEVQTEEDMKIVSGLLWKRIKIGMPLQVDSAPRTYTTRGLPLEPIGNPGLTSIKAALNPTDSPYLYFISDKEGKTHYARTLDEHIKNIQKYL